VDVRGDHRHVRQVPQPDSLTAANNPRRSITSSAAPNRDGGSHQP
jgi:hypothetical protein